MTRRLARKVLSQNKAFSRFESDYAPLVRLLIRATRWAIVRHRRAKRAREGAKEQAKAAAPQHVHNLWLIAPGGHHFPVTGAYAEHVVYAALTLEGPPRPAEKCRIDISQTCEHGFRCEVAR